MIDAIIEGHIMDITEWALRDIGALKTWLEGVLNLDVLTKTQLLAEYSAYLHDPDEEEA